MTTRYKANLTLISLLAIMLPSVCLGQPTEDEVADEKESGFSLGAGVALQPKYMGSDNMTAAPIIHVAYDFGNGFFASTTDGIGVGFSHEVYNGINLIAGTSFSFSEERKDKKELKGMGKVKGSLISTVKAGVDIKSRVTLSVGANIPLTERDNGSTYFVSVETPVYKTDNNNVTLSTTLSYFDKKYSKTYFGVNNEQSAATRYRQYTPKSGIGQVEAGVLWTHQFNKKWSTVSFLGVSQLLGDAADSPIVKQKTAPTAALGVIYNF